MKDKFNQNIADMICEMIASNNSLVTICSLDYMPTLAVISRWLTTDTPECQAFKKAYEFAQEVKADYLFEEIIDIADDNNQDELVKTNRAGEEYTVENREFVSRSKIKIETRLKYISQLKPRKYGKNQVVDTTDKDKLKELFNVLSQGPVKRIIDNEAKN